MFGLRSSPQTTPIWCIGCYDVNLCFRRKPMWAAMGAASKLDESGEAAEILIVERHLGRVFAAYGSCRADSRTNDRRSKVWPHSPGSIGLRPGSPANMTGMRVSAIPENSAFTASAIQMDALGCQISNPVNNTNTAPKPMQIAAPPLGG
ncbi:MAG: hypothetical protein KGL62_09870 [Bradyrhizobium sp.]|uniref:hypothetical protein n=1 Tax=Bradyrhizobium sp. TaxID=376 RepID=UPI0023920EFD|nr:hypothetical protein [Bradyrhizobium sp.]MDE2602660.1 hypothetical protein [Bradyrhizobium sp.]